MHKTESMKIVACKIMLCESVNSKKLFHVINTTLENFQEYLIKLKKLIK